ncbi:hypothetical protein [Sphingosinicella sp. YJ22]|uniref:hypothetical protein n=1 Tax=Sphingosinicella sp. YJ22 TaxID=1104780 RepID=UPI00140CFE3A|nr:hypothetical protein [Sphingosinicella sp. YJ22]
MAIPPDRIGTLVIGPQAGGRGYRLLARSEGPDLSAAAEARLSELALVIAGWADEEEPEAIALVPLADATTPAVLLRLAYLGTASLGTMAFANGLILDSAAFAACAGRPETLLDLIPAPDGSRDFAMSPLAAPIAAPRQQVQSRDWTGLGLQWRDRMVVVQGPEEVEPTLRSVLASVGPAGPGARVRGWATTALLPSSGSFSPPRELQLLVLHQGQRRAAGLHYLPAAATPGGFEGERVSLPPAARAWERLKALAVDPDLAEAVGPLRWSPSHFDLPPAEVVGPAADTVLRRLSGGAAQMRLVTELARPRGEDLDAPFAQVARGLFAQLLGRPGLEPQHSAFYVKALADAPPEAANAMGPLGRDLVHPGNGRWLRGLSFARLLELGYAEALAERSDEARDLLDGLGADELALLLDRVMLARDGRLREPALISAILRLLADQTDADSAPEWRGVYAAALQWRLAEPAAEDELRLGARSVVRLTHRLARPQMARLAQRTLRLRDSALSQPRERLDMLGGALEWVRLEGAAA